MKKHASAILLTSAFTLLAVGIVVDQRLEVIASKARILDSTHARWRDSKKISVDEYQTAHLLLIDMFNPRFEFTTVYRYLVPVALALASASAWCGRYNDNAQTTRSEAEQDGTGQPATRSESQSNDNTQPQPEAEGRSR